MAKYDLPEPPAPPIGLSEGRRKGLFSRLFSRKKDVLSEIKIEPILTSELDYEEKKGLAELEKKERLAKKHISKEQEFLHITKQKILEATSKVKSGRDVDKIKELLKHKTQIIDQKEKRVNEIKALLKRQEQTYFLSNIQLSKDKKDAHENLKKLEDVLDTIDINSEAQEKIRTFIRDQEESYRKLTYYHKKVIKFCIIKSEPLPPIHFAGFTRDNMVNAINIGARAFQDALPELEEMYVSV